MPFRSLNQRPPLLSAILQAPPGIAWSTSSYLVTTTFDTRPELLPAVVLGLPLLDLFRKIVWVVTPVIVIATAAAMTSRLLTPQPASHSCLIVGSSLDASDPIKAIIVGQNWSLAAATEYRSLHQPYTANPSSTPLAFSEGPSWLMFPDPCLVSSTIPSKTPTSSNGY